MSKFSKKVSDKLDDAADSVFAAGLKRGPKTAAAANTACRIILGRYYERCDDPGCAHPGHEHD